MAEGKGPQRHDGAPGTGRDEDDYADRELPRIRDEIRTAAQYGAAGQWAQKRRSKIRNEIERNRRGEYRVPTWVLAVILVAFVTAWVLVIVLS